MIKQTLKKLSGLLFRSRSQTSLDDCLVNEPITETPAINYINDRHQYLSEERERLGKAEEAVSDNIDFIFEQYEAIPVSFDVYAGNDYRSVDSDTLGSRLVIDILRKYLKCELPQWDDYNRETEVERFKKDMRGDIPLIFDANGWRVSFRQLYEKTDDGDYNEAPGFTANLYHNFGGHRKTDNPGIVKNQLRYRILINDVERMLIEKEVKYELKETNWFEVNGSINLNLLTLPFNLINNLIFGCED